MGQMHGGDYILTEDSYNRYEELLVIQGIGVKKLRVDIHEDLVREEKTHIVSGDLEFNSVLFPFSITKQGDRFELEIQLSTINNEATAALMQVLLKTFPQPERKIHKVAQPARGVSRTGIWGRIGCLFVWIVITSFLGLSVLGFISLVRYWK